MQKNWRPREADTPPLSFADWAEQLEVSEHTVQLLWLRGLRTPEEMAVYLTPGLRHLAHPDTYPGLEQAAQVLADGLSQGKTFAVWGDYDVDGVTSTALVKDFLKQHGIEALHHIPNRMEEGYGLNAKGIEKLAEEGVELLLTVDCGITNVAEINRANELGIDVVVSDHHLPHEGPDDTLPPAAAICNPRLDDCPCPHLAGVGVAFLLMCKVNRLLPTDPLDMSQFLDLVALGTVADIVKLTGQNRILVKNGLLLIKEAKRCGIYALKEASGMNPTAEVGSGRVSFGLAPRINAAGRLGEAEIALQMLLADKIAVARPLAEKLESMNRDRQQEEDRITEEALKQAAAYDSDPGFVLFGDDWHSGVIGITASRVVEKWYRPTLVLTEENGMYKGSGRSIKEFDLFQAVTECADLLEIYGGHKQAAGLTIRPENLCPLRMRFNKAVVKQLGPDVLTPSLNMDFELGLDVINYAFIKEMEAMQPFGIGNPEPVFASPPLYVEHWKLLGKDHAALVLRDEKAGVSLSAKAWRQAKVLNQSFRGKTIRIAFSPKLNTWKGRTSIELIIKDFQQVL